MTDKMELTDGEKKVEATWEELGYRIRALRFFVFVRTEPHKEKVGKLWLPPRMSTFHGELPHLYHVTGLVLSAGPAGVSKNFKPGDRIVFQRLHFAYHRQFEDKTFIGWVDANQVLGFADDGVEVAQYAPSIL